MTAFLGNKSLEGPYPSVPSTNENGSELCYGGALFFAYHMLKIGDLSARTAPYPSYPPYLEK